jgi:hypothetical protein
MDIAGGGMSVGEPESARASIATLFSFSFILITACKCLDTICPTGSSKHAIINMS